MTSDDGSGRRKSRSDPEVRKTVLVLSGLLGTGDDGLEEFRERRAGGSVIGLEQLKQVRDMLDAFGAALRGQPGPSLARVERAWVALCGEEGALAPARPTDVELGPSSAPAFHPHAVAVQSPSLQMRPPQSLDFEALNRVRVSLTEERTILDAVVPAPRSVLPFGPSDAKAPPPPPPAKAPQPSSDALHGTTSGEVMSPFHAHVLPFQPQKPGPRPSEPGIAAPPESAVPPARESSASAAPRLAELAPPSSSRSQTGPLLEPPPHLVALTVEQYAALCAECAVNPSWTAQIQARYQVHSDAERALLDRSWRQRLATDRAENEAWRWHYARYEQWARGQRR